MPGSARWSSRSTRSTSTRRRAVPDAPRAGEDGVPAIHVGFHPRAGRRSGDAREPDREPEQIKADYFEDTGGVPPQDTTVVSWLPFYHDMGLMLGIFGPIAYGSTPC